MLYMIIFRTKSRRKSCKKEKGGIWPKDKKCLSNEVKRGKGKNIEIYLVRKPRRENIVEIQETLFKCAKKVETNEKRYRKHLSIFPSLYGIFWSVIISIVRTSRIFMVTHHPTHTHPLTPTHCHDMTTPAHEGNTCSRCH